VYAAADKNGGGCKTLFGAIDRYFGWVSSGGFKRLFLAGLLPLLIVIFIVAAALGGGGESTKDDDSGQASSLADSEANDSKDDQSQTTAPRLTATPRPTETPRPTATPAPPTQTPEPAGYSFTDGTKLVPSEVQATTYRRRQGGGNCYWARLSGLGGTLGEIITNENTSYPEVVTIGPGDKAFQSRGCGRWTQDLSSITNSPTDPFKDGTYQVGVDIAPGTWRADATSTCYWARLRNFGGGLDGIIANGNDPGPVVTISASDKGFRSSRCGTWTKIG
jgi:hypothetical protein